MLAMMPFCSSSRIIVEGLPLIFSANSLTVRLGGISTGSVGSAMATAAALALLDASVLGRFWGLRRGPGRRGPRYCMCPPFFCCTRGRSRCHPEERRDEGLPAVLNLRQILRSAQDDNPAPAATTSCG